MLDIDVREDALDLEQERQTEPEITTAPNSSQQENNLTAREIARDESHLGQCTGSCCPWYCNVYQKCCIPITNIHS